MQKPIKASSPVDFPPQGTDDEGHDIARIVEDILGGQKVEGVRVRNVKTGKQEVIKCDGVFVAIGHQPNTSIFQGQIELDEKRYVITRHATATSAEGVFAAGDVHDFHYRQAVTAAGDGCRAALDVRDYLETKGLRVT